jgi:hypothetical protein
VFPAPAAAALLVPAAVPVPAEPALVELVELELPHAATAAAQTTPAASESSRERNA